jgi:hypothetical protein
MTKSVNRLCNASAIGIGEAITVSDFAFAEIVKTYLMEILELLGIQ